MDWKKLIADLSELGATQTAIADFCDCSQSTISEIGRGEIKNPSFAIGTGLVKLHTKLSAKQKKAA